jgi:cytochrome c oxidase subunit 4
MTVPPKHELTHEHFAEDPEEQVDPHGFAKGHKHGHVIVSVFTLRAVLTILLTFTVLTVFFAQGEKWVEATFDVVMPHWVNVVVAMSIATIKSVVVAAYFMQLKYDNPINTAIFMFCLLALGLFMGFTLLDLGMRDQIYRFKAGEIQQGGLGGITRPAYADGKRLKDNETIPIPITQYAAKQLEERVGPEKYQEMRREMLEHAKHGPQPRPKPTVSTPDQSRPKTGPTPGLFDQTAPEPTEGHGEHSSGEQGGGH